jgi:hypothetical protein
VLDDRFGAAWDNSIPGGPPHYDPIAVANPTSGLRLALRDTANGETPEPATAVVARHAACGGAHSISNPAWAIASIAT